MNPDYHYIELRSDDMKDDQFVYLALPNGGIHGRTRCVGSSLMYLVDENGVQTAHNHRASIIYLVDKMLKKNLIDASQL